jgi:hypothetical protein
MRRFIFDFGVRKGEKEMRFLDHNATPHFGSPKCSLIEERADCTTPSQAFERKKSFELNTERMIEL